MAQQPYSQFLQQRVASCPAKKSLADITSDSSSDAETTGSPTASPQQLIAAETGNQNASNYQLPGNVEGTESPVCMLCKATHIEGRCRFNACSHHCHVRCLRELAAPKNKCSWLHALEYVCPSCHKGSHGHPDSCKPCESWKKGNECPKLKSGSCTGCHLNHAQRKQPRRDKRTREIMKKNRELHSSNQAALVLVMILLLSLAATVRRQLLMPGLSEQGACDASWQSTNMSTKPSDSEVSNAIGMTNAHKVCPSILDSLVVRNFQCCTVLQETLDKRRVATWQSAECIARSIVIVDAHWSFSDPASYFSDFQPPSFLRANASHWAYYALHLLSLAAHNSKMMGGAGVAWCRLAMKISEVFYFSEDIASTLDAQRIALQATGANALGQEGARCLAVAYFMEGTLAYEEWHNQAKAEGLFEDSLKLLRKNGLGDSPEYADIQIQLAKSYLIAQRRGLALELFGSSLRLKQTLMRTFNSTPGSMYCSGLAQLGYASLYSPEVAEHNFREAAICFEAAESDGYMTKVALASAIAQQGRWEESRNLLESIITATVSEWPYSVYALASMCLGDIALHEAHYEFGNAPSSNKFAVALQQYEPARRNASLINNTWLRHCMSDRLPFTDPSLWEKRGPEFHGPLVGLCTCPHRI